MLLLDISDIEWVDPEVFPAQVRAWALLRNGLLRRQRYFWWTMSISEHGNLFVYAERRKSLLDTLPTNTTKLLGINHPLELRMRKEGTHYGYQVVINRAGNFENEQGKTIFLEEAVDLVMARFSE